MTSQAWATPPGLTLLELEKQLEKREKELEECLQHREEESALHAQDFTKIASLELQLALHRGTKDDNNETGTKHLLAAFGEADQTADADNDPLFDETARIDELEKELAESNEKREKCEEGRKRYETIIKGLKGLNEGLMNIQAAHGGALKGRDDQITELEIKLLHCELKTGHQWDGAQDQKDNEQTIRDLRVDQAEKEQTIKKIREEIESLKLSQENCNSSNDKDAELKSFQSQLTDCKKHRRKCEEQRTIAEGEMNGLKRIIEVLNNRIAQSPSTAIADDEHMIRARNETLEKDLTQSREMYIQKSDALQKCRDEVKIHANRVRELEGHPVHIPAQLAQSFPNSRGDEILECQKHQKEAEDENRKLKERVKELEQGQETLVENTRTTERQLEECQAGNTAQEVKRHEGKIRELDEEHSPLMTRDLSLKVHAEEIEKLQAQLQTCREEARRQNERSTVAKTGEKFVLENQNTGRLEAQLREAYGVNAGLRHELDVANANIDRLRAVPADARITYGGVANRGQPRQEDSARIKELCDRIKEQNREMASLENRLEQVGQRAGGHKIQDLLMQLDGKKQEVLRLMSRNEEIYRELGELRDGRAVARSAEMVRILQGQVQNLESQVQGNSTRSRIGSSLLEQLRATSSEAKEEHQRRSQLDDTDEEAIEEEREEEEKEDKPTNEKRKRNLEETTKEAEERITREEKEKGESKKRQNKIDREKRALEREKKTKENERKMAEKKAARAAKAAETKAGKKRPRADAEDGGNDVRDLKRLKL